MRLFENLGVVSGAKYSAVLNGAIVSNGLGLYTITGLSSIGFWRADILALRQDRVAGFREVVVQEWKDPRAEGEVANQLKSRCPVGPRRGGKPSDPLPCRD